jgi:Rab GDP dissociation inhibitor
LQNLFKKFNGGAEPPKAFFDALGQNRDYNVDLIPKFIMANGAPRLPTRCGELPSQASSPRTSLGHRRPALLSRSAGNLVKILVHTDVTRYLDFKLIDGSYVYRSGSGIHKVPADGAEALRTGLVGFFQKHKLKGFLEYIAKYDPANPATHKGA